MPDRSLMHLATMSPAVALLAFACLATVSASRVGVTNRMRHAFQNAVLPVLSYSAGVNAARAAGLRAASKACRYSDVRLSITLLLGPFLPATTGLYSE